MCRRFKFLAVLLVPALLVSSTISAPSIAQTLRSTEAEEDPVARPAEFTADGTAGAPMDVEFVEILVAKSRFAGALLPAPYGFEISVEGNNIDAVAVVTHNGTELVLTQPEPGHEWRYYQDGFVSLCDVASQIGFGDYEFTFTAPDSSTDTVTLPFDPTCTDPHPGYADGISPGHGQTDVAIDLTLTWVCTGGPCGNFAWYMEIYPTVGDGAEFENDLLNPLGDQWTPGLLSPNTPYGFWVSAGTILGGASQVLTTSSGDDFVYPPGFETTNEIEFTTAGASSGNVPPTMLLRRVSPTTVELSWSESDCPGVQDYGIYQGTVGDWNSHEAIDCHDDGGDLTEIVVASSGDTYYLVVPFNNDSEGSYGADSLLAERPQSTFSPCRALQVVGCP